MKKVISITLWGDSPMYNVGAIENAILCPDVYPGWICRFYVDSSVPEGVIDGLKNLNCEIVLKEKTVDHLASFWRFEPMFDPEVEYFIVRDADSRIDNREKEAVEEWRYSGKTVHIMRDHPNHFWEIMGGMWGASNKLLEDVPTLKDDFYRYYNILPKENIVFETKQYFSYNQTFLKDCLWPHIKDNHIAHDEFIKITGFELPFKSPRRDNSHFVGQKYTEDNKPVFRI